MNTRKHKNNICVILAMVIILTAFMSDNITVKAANPKNANYYFHTYDIKTFKKSKGKLTIICRKNGLMAYDIIGGKKDRYTKKVTYKIAKGCKWKFVDNDEKIKKASYDSVRKRIKWDGGDWENPNRIHMKVRKGKITKIIVYRYYG